MRVNEIYVHTMNRSEALHQRLTLLCIVLLIAASAVPILAARQLYRPIDDTYITMVYARSLAQGHGFTFGLSDHQTLGTTTPLNTLLLAALYALFPNADAAGIAITLSVIAWIATGWLWWIGGGVFGLNRLECFSIAVLVLIETTTWIAHLGMETWLFVFLLTLCAMIYFHGKLFLTGVLIGLIFLTRGEGILIAAVIGLHLVRQWRSRQPNWFRHGLQIAAGAALILIPWAIYATLTFGSPLPSTLAAKAVQTQLGFTQPFIVYLIYVFVGEWSNLGIFGVSPWLLLFIGGLIYAVRAHRKLLILPAWALLFVTGYFLLNIPTYKWYALPVMYIVTVFAGLALAGIAPLVARLGDQSLRARRIGTAAAVAALIIVAVIILPKNIPTAPVGDWRHDVYQTLAQWLDSNTPEGSSVAYVEIGLLAWYGNRPVIDLLGLTNPELIPAVRRGDIAAAFAQAQPDTLICASLFAWACRDIITSADFKRDYRQAAMFTGAELGAPEIADDSFVIYERQK